MFADYDPKIDGNYICYYCDSSCKKCFGTTAYDCTSCFSNYDLIDNMCLKNNDEELVSEIEFAYLKEISNPYLFKISFHESIVYDISIEEFSTIIDTLSVSIKSED